LVANGSK